MLDRSGCDENRSDRLVLDRESRRIRPRQSVSGHVHRLKPVPPLDKNQETGLETCSTGTITEMHLPISGLDAGEVQIPAGDGTIPGYRAMPAGGKTFPVVLVIQEIFGVHEHIKDICRRFAKLGYMAIAPEMYARQGDVSRMDDHQQIIEKVVSKVPDAQVMSDLDATVDWATSTGLGDAARLGRIAE